MEKESTLVVIYVMHSIRKKEKEKEVRRSTVKSKCLLPRSPAFGRY